MARATMAMGRVVARPQNRKHTMVLRRPTMMVGFRPMLSDSRPQGTAVTLCASEKTADVTPAQKATSFFSMPKL